MKNFVNVLIIVLTLGTFSSAFAADTKVQGRLYANWNMDLSDSAESANSFNVKRAYVTIKSKLSNNSSVRITTDIRETEGFDGYSIILKYGYIDMKPEFGNGNFKIRLGLQPTLFIDNMNKLWSRRYLEKTVGDKNKFLTTSDLGASAFLNLGKKGKTGYVALQVLNGTSYSDTKELNKNKDIGLFALLKPFANNEEFNRSRFLVQGYFGTQNESLLPGVDLTATGANIEASQFTHNIISVGGMLGYKKKFDFGFETNFMTKGNGYNETTGFALEDVKTSGISLFGTLYFNGLTNSESSSKNLNLFGRFDILDPNTDLDNDGKSLLIVGLECNPAKGFKASLNLRTTSFEDNTGSESELFVNTLFKF